MEKEILFSREEIKEKVVSLGKMIEKDFEDDFVVISLLRGSFIFAADLVREIDRLVEIKFLWTLFLIKNIRNPILRMSIFEWW